MTARSMLRIIGALALLATPAPARAQDGLDKDSFETFGGTYQSDCGNARAPRLTIFQDALVYIQGDTRIAGAHVQNAPSYYGQDVPETYRTALLGDVEGGSQLIFVVHEDAKGRFVTLDGDTKLMARVSPGMKQMKFRPCVAAATPAKPAAEAPAKPAPATPATVKAGASGSEIGIGMTASAMLADRKFKSAYYKALGARVSEPWLAKLDGPSVETKKVKVAGAEYMLIVACKDHDCHDNNTVLLWSAPRKLVYGLVLQAGRTAFIGAPTSALATELRALWKQEWRSNE